MRKVAREVAFKFIYEYLYNEVRLELEDLELVKKSDLDDNDIDYLNVVYNGVIDKIDVLKEKIEKHAEGYSIDRIFKIDLSILMLALFEMKYVDDVPKKVAINEAVEMSKIYSTKKSGAFINGILGSIAYGRKE